jgi:TrfA protein
MATKPSLRVTHQQLVLPIQLPFWPSEIRGLPNAFARSALFTVANTRKGDRANFKRKDITAVNGVQIQYTGEELRQDDEDVFLQILHVARVQELGTEVRFTAYSLLQELGWSKNTASYKRLVDCLDRLKASSVAVTVESAQGAKENYTGSLIRSFRWREDGAGMPLRQWTVLLEKEIISLFNPASYSRLDWKLRLNLPPLAKWLHSFYMTGSEIAELRKFRYKLKQALEILVVSGFFMKARVDPHTDLVMVERSTNTATRYGSIG